MLAPPLLECPSPPALEVFRIWWQSRMRKWSIFSKAERKVVDHISAGQFANCLLHVSPAGRERVRKTGQKNVHAWILGQVNIFPSSSPAPWRRLQYNPWKNDYFVWSDSGEAVGYVDEIQLTAGGKVWGRNL